MSLVLPIIVMALVLGMSVKKMTPALWVLMALVIILSATYFYLKH